MATTKEKQSYLKQIKAYKKKHGTMKGAPKFGRYLQNNEPGSRQTRAMYKTMDSGTYSDIRKMRKKKVK